MDVLFLILKFHCIHHDQQFIVYSTKARFIGFANVRYSASINEDNNFSDTDYDNHDRGKMPMSVRRPLWKQID